MFIQDVGTSASLQTGRVEMALPLRALRKCASMFSYLPGYTKPVLQQCL